MLLGELPYFTHRSMLARIPAPATRPLLPSAKRAPRTASVRSGGWVVPPSYMTRWISKIPFRMEMSAFARHEGSIPVIGDIGQVWPILAWKVAGELGISLDFMSYAQHTPEGKAMREWIVREIQPVDREKILARARTCSLPVEGESRRS